MDRALKELIRISRETGADPTLVQGGGGNTSVKTADGTYMYIKASGTALKDMNATEGWRRLRLDLVRSVAEDESLAQMPTQAGELEVVNRLLRACDDDIKVEARPSVEAHLHAWLDKYVIHLHPSAAGAYVNARNGKATLEKLFKAESLPPLWVPYADPGYMLAGRIAKLVEGYRNQFGKGPAMLFLEKHGLLITADSAASALRLVRHVIERCNRGLRQPKAGKAKPVSRQDINAVRRFIRRAYFEATGARTMVSYHNDGAVEEFCRRKDARRMLSGSLTPDELVYANGPAMWVELHKGWRSRSEAARKGDSASIAARLRRQIEKGRKPAAAFLVKGIGLLIAGPERLAPTVRDIVLYSIFIRSSAHRMGGICTLNKRQEDFISNWESEAFRKKLAGADTSGELRNHIAVVTGAGSGLGRSIAIGLASAGATVALADIDEDAAIETADKIATERPESQTMVVPCNVTSESSVRKAFEAVLAHWGGLDVLVNAAGVAPPYPLVDMPADKWRVALEVNLTGYFLMAREAAKILIEQGMGGNIINLSSKSGLDASKNNTAYNATKAGELHMARGWALELGEHGIRVNSVAPGNVFEGSKIWNPDYIRVCARKYGIEPDEVIPYYVNKTALKREIRGQDVADAVVFLCSEKARTITGQVLVPDAGQAMVR